MKINTSAQEMALQVPEEDDLAAIKAAIPNPANFPLPDPGDVFDNYVKWSNDNPAATITNSTRQFLTGEKRGGGTALASYPMLYQKAIRPLEELWDIKDSPEEVVTYLLDNPIQYKVDKDPYDAIDSEGNIYVPDFVARCFSNLFEWLYLPSNPVYQYLREHLLEKARWIRNLYRKESAFNRVKVRSLPQRPYTSRSLGKDELPINKVNGGYRVIYTPDPFAEEDIPVLELVTWFYSDAKTKANFYVDYFDVENGDIDAAVRELRSSPLYRQWAQKLNPQQYDAICANFRVNRAFEDEELRQLTKLD